MTLHTHVAEALDRATITYVPTGSPPDLGPLPDTTLLALDLETNGLDPKTAGISCITLATPDWAFIFDPSHINALRPILDAPTRTFLIQHAPFDCGFLYAKYGIKLGKVYDTRLQEKELNTHRGTPHLSCSLAPQILRYFGITLDKSLATSFTHAIPTHEQLRYTAHDALVLFPLLHAQALAWGTRTSRGALLMYSYIDGLLPVLPDTR